MAAFPPNRLTVERGSWLARLFLLLWLPVGVLVVLPLRTIVFFTVLGLHLLGVTDLWAVAPSIVGWSCKVRYVEDDAEPGPDGEYPPKSFKEGAGHGQAHSLARLMTTPGKTVLAVEHHMAYVEGLMFRSVMKQAFTGAYCLVGRGTTQDGLVSKMLDPYVIPMFPGDKLGDGLRKWRERCATDPAPLTVFPAGTTSEPSTVVAMLPRLFELIQPDEQVRPVCVDFATPLPAVNARGLGCANASDMAWYAITPWLEATFTVLPPVPQALMDKAARNAALSNGEAEDRTSAAAAACASYCEQAIAVNSITVKERVPVNLFHKRAWEKLVVAADYPYFKWIETGAMQWLQTQTQAPPFRWTATALHFATLEPVVVLVGALLLYSGAEPGALFGPLGRALAVNMCVMHALKQIFRVPRPAWAKGPQLPNRPQLLSPPLASHEWSMPSGHAGFMGCVHGAVAVLCSAGSLNLCPAQSTGSLALWTHLCLGAMTCLAATARVWLSLHWPSDVLVGAGVGSVVGATYCALLDRYFLDLSASHQVLLVAGLGLVFGAFCSFNSVATILEVNAFKTWSRNALHAVNPCSKRPWLLALAVFTGIFMAVPLTVPQVAPHTGHTDVSIIRAAVGMFLTGTAMLVIVVLPMKALRGAVSRAQMAHSGAVKASRVPAACPVQARTARRLTLLKAAEDWLLFVGIVAGVQAMNMIGLYLNSRA